MRHEVVARRPMVSRVAVIALLGAAVAGAPSCDPVEPRPLTKAPVNRCPCDAYEPGATAAARCSTGNRCEILTPGGTPAFPIWIVVHVPTSSIFAPGHTYVLYSDAQGKPAFRAPSSPGTGSVSRCQPPRCLALGSLVAATGSYQVTQEVSELVGYPLDQGSSIPVRVLYEPIGNEQAESFPALPLDTLFASSYLNADGVAEVARPIPSARYRRIFYPQPPFDAFFPPRADEIPPTTTPFLVDAVFLGAGISLDDGVSRTATISRADGLDGWRVWLVDRPSQRRISVLRTLSGTEAEVPLFTSGAQLAFQRDDVDAVVAPPESWTAVPRYVTPLFSGAGLTLAYPSIPPPVTVTGVVAEPGEAEEGVVFGYAARVTFDSEALATNTDPSRLLRYSTSLNTDDRGRFATVLPPGTYAATVEPAEGTGYAKRREIVIVDRTHVSLRFQPPPRTLVKGRAVLTDGRALSEADVIAVPSASGSRANRLVPRPRPGRTQTGEDGRFAFELDPGGYVLSIIPKPGTGFPRVVVRPDIPGSSTGQETELPEIRVPAPTRLAFTLRDPSRTGNAIASAMVRIFARPAVSGGSPGGAALPEPVEIGSAMTDSDGSVEILLAQEPR